MGWMDRFRTPNEPAPDASAAMSWLERVGGGRLLSGRTLDQHGHYRFSPRDMEILGDHLANDLPQLMTEWLQAGNEQTRAMLDQGAEDATRPALRGEIARRMELIQWLKQPAAQAQLAGLSRDAMCVAELKHRNDPSLDPMRVWVKQLAGRINDAVLRGDGLGGMPVPLFEERAATERFFHFAIMPLTNRIHHEIGQIRDGESPEAGHGR